MGKTKPPTEAKIKQIPLASAIGRNTRQRLGDLTIEMFKDAIPPKMHKSISVELIDQLNTTITDPIALEQFRENLLSFSSVLKGSKFTMAHYIAAVKYVSLLALGDKKKEAFLKTFPEKHKRITAEGIPDSHVKAYASAYHSTKIVTLLLELMLVPIHLMNAGMFQEALNVQATLMKSAKSEKVRCDAAAVLLQHLKPPETKKFELDIGYKEDDSIKALRASTLALARQQQEMIEKGTASTQTIAISPIAEEAKLVE